MAVGTTPICTSSARRLGEAEARISVFSREPGAAPSAVSPAPMVMRLLEPIDDAALGQVIRRHFDLNLVACQYTDAVLAHFSSSMGDDFMAVLELYPECCIWQQLDNGPGEFECFFFGHVGSVIDFLRGTCVGGALNASMLSRCMCQDALFRPVSHGRAVAANCLPARTMIFRRRFRSSD